MADRGTHMIGDDETDGKDIGGHGKTPGLKKGGGVALDLHC
jgi:hypothetical protein